MLIGFPETAGNDVESFWNGHVMAMMSEGVVEKIQQRILHQTVTKTSVHVLVYGPYLLCFLILQE